MTYKSFEEKNVHFSSSFIEDAEELDLFRKDIANNGYIFRGLNEAKFKLITSLQRHFLSPRINQIQYQSQFEFMDQEIKALKSDSVLPSYYKALGAPISDYLYMSFLQHYEAPTTLMDFTEDLDVALFFASRNTHYPQSAKDNEIENYVSLYYIEDVSSLSSILQQSINQCVNKVSTWIDSAPTRNNDNRKEGDSDIVKLKDLVSLILSFKSLEHTELGYIVGDNKSKFRRTYIEEVYYQDLYNGICRYLKTRSDTASLYWKNSIRFLLQQTIVIANLNQIAQKGCFIHYMPHTIDIPLEDYTNPISGTKINIHCVNIHKSLCPHIKHLIPHDQESLFPEPKAMAGKSYEKSIQ